MVLQIKQSLLEKAAIFVCPSYTDFGSYASVILVIYVITLSNLIKETIVKQLSLFVLQKNCFKQFGNFTRNIGGGGLYVFRKASLKASVINSSF